MNYLDMTIIGNMEDETAMPLNEIAEHLERLNNWEMYFETSTGYFIKRVFAFNNVDKARGYITESQNVLEDMNTNPYFVLKGTDVEVRCNSSQLKGIHLNDIIAAAHLDELYDRWDIITGERDKVTQASDESFPASDPPGY